MNKIIIFGGTGFLGRHLRNALIQKGYEVFVVNRKDNSSNLYWDYQNKDTLLSLLVDKDIVINLAGSPIIGKRWNEKVKKDLIDSREVVNRILVETINKLQGNRIKLYISASGIGYYGNTFGSLVDETSNSGNDFVSEICKRWESSLDKLKIRKVIFRIGVVLHSSGGAFPKMALPFKYFVGSALGSGSQFFPWIHLKDLISLFVFAIENENISGVYNACSSDKITNKEFSKALAKLLSRPLLPNVPAFILKLIIGESATVLLIGQKVSNEKIKKAGFEFQYDEITSCLKNIDKL